MTSYEGVKAWRKANPEKRKEQNRRYHEKHPETRKKAIEKYRANNRERIRELDKQNQRKYRSDPVAQRERYERWRTKRLTQREQLAGRPRPHRCEVCGQQAKRIVFDHCHDCGEFRGWLCDRCNRLLGVVNDDPALLRRLARHLEIHHGKAHNKSKKKATQVAIWDTE